ncbi:MauE/DoxX family redox-associated membrane protein [Nocardia sp. NPDC020380]|uniref:MauE/DoxX family redox-associated membrane protein n=1 Tax=Nocardia sp. NPDC020380 TaxID=3364309 RepID=UPI00378B05C5
MKRYLSALLWAALAAQAGWTVTNTVWLHQKPGVDPLGLFLLTAFAALALGFRPRVVAAVQVLVGLEFLELVADRTGLLGPQGGGVSWGDFTHFVSYTRQVTSFLPPGWAPALAVAATLAEVTLGVALIARIRVREASWAGGLLLLTYAVAMTLSLPIADAFHYLVFVQAAGILSAAAYYAPRTERSTVHTLRGRWMRPRPATTVRLPS